MANAWLIMTWRTQNLLKFGQPEPTCTPELLEESLLNRRVDWSAKLPLHASYHALVFYGQPDRQLGVQRCPHGVEVAGRGRVASRDRVVAWIVAKLLLWLLRAFGDALGSHGPRVHSLPHHHDFLLQQLPLAVLEAVELPLPLGEHLSIQWGLRCKYKQINKQQTEFEGERMV